MEKAMEMLIDSTVVLYSPFECLKYFAVWETNNFGNMLEAGILLQKRGIGLL